MNNLVKCIYCGAGNPPHSKFCSVCGGTLPSEPRGAENSKEPKQTISSQQQPVLQQSVLSSQQPTPQRSASTPQQPTPQRSVSAPQQPTPQRSVPASQQSAPQNQAQMMQRSHVRTAAPAGRRRKMSVGSIIVSVLICILLVPALTLTAFVCSVRFSAGRLAEDVNLFELYSAVADIGMKRATTEYKDVLGNLLKEWEEELEQEPGSENALLFLVCLGDDVSGLDYFDDKLDGNDPDKLIKEVTKYVKKQMEKEKFRDFTADLLERYTDDLRDANG